MVTIGWSTTCGDTSLPSAFTWSLYCIGIPHPKSAYSQPTLDHLRPVSIAKLFKMDCLVCGSRTLTAVVATNQEIYISLVKRVADVNRSVTRSDIFPRVLSVLMNCPHMACWFFHSKCLCNIQHTKARDLGFDEQCFNVDAIEHVSSLWTENTIPSSRQYNSHIDQKVFLYIRNFVPEYSIAKQ